MMNAAAMLTGILSYMPSRWRTRWLATPPITAPLKSQRRTPTILSTPDQKAETSLHAARRCGLGRRYRRKGQRAFRGSCVALPLAGGMGIRGTALRIAGAADGTLGPAALLAARRFWVARV